MAKSKEEIKKFSTCSGQVDEFIMRSNQLAKDTQYVDNLKQALVNIATPILDTEKVKTICMLATDNIHGITVQRKDSFSVKQESIAALMTEFKENFNAYFDRVETISIKPEMLKIVFEKFTEAEREQFFATDVKYKTKKGFDQIYVEMNAETRARIADHVVWAKPSIVTG